MRRRVVPTIAVLVVIAQMALAASAHLGLVLCIGADHAAIESAADDCCAAHGTVGTNPVAMIERDCCSDIPLYTVARPLSDVPRSYAPATSFVATLPVVAGDGVIAPPVELPHHHGGPPDPPAGRRSIVLRV